MAMARAVLAALLLLAVAAAGAPKEAAEVKGPSGHDPAVDLIGDDDLAAEEAIANGAHDEVRALRKEAADEAAAEAAEESRKTEDERIDDVVESITKKIPPTRGAGLAPKRAKPEEIPDPDEDEFMKPANEIIKKLALESVAIKATVQGKKLCQYVACPPDELECPAHFVVKKKRAWKGCCFNPVTDCKANETDDPSEEESASVPVIDVGPANDTIANDTTTADDPAAKEKTGLYEAGKRYCLLPSMYGKHLQCESHAVCRQRGLGLCSPPLETGSREELVKILKSTKESKLFGEGDDECAETCSGHTHCNAVTGACECDFGYHGLNCTNRTLLHGDCQGDICTCNQGWEGATCDVQICPGHCSGHGKCDHSTYRCLCDGGFKGDACDEDLCWDRNNCSNTGICNNGTCLCEDGFGGQDCSIPECVVQTSQRQGQPPKYVVCADNGKCVDGRCHCDKGWGGTNCMHRICPEGCGVHGGCDTKTHKCMCDPGWYGDDCMKPKCPRDCSGHGSCIDHGEMAGKCACSLSWTGIACSKPTCGKENACNGNGECVEGHCKCKEGFKGALCLTKSCPNDCHSSWGQGRCINGKCFCSTDWGGETCNVKQCKDGCNDHGICNQGTCSCDNKPGDSWTGKWCDVPTCYHGCSGHGECLDNFTCACDTGWGGDGCEERTTCENPCVHGKCKHGSCWCNLGYTGDDCSKPTCPGNCNGHGTCMGTFCKCKDTWIMDDCSLRKCPGHPEECNGRGECYNGTCKCTPQYHGAACEKTCPTAKPGKPCSGNGKCKLVKNSPFGPSMPAADLHESRCFCYAGFTGHDCNQRTCPGSCSGNGYCSTLTGKCQCKPTYVGADCSYSTNDPSVCARNCSNRCIVECRDVYNDVMDSVASKNKEGKVGGMNTSDIAEMAQKETQVCVRHCVDTCLNDCMRMHVLSNPLAITQDPAATEGGDKPLHQ